MSSFFSCCFEKKDGEKGGKEKKRKSNGEVKVVSNRYVSLIGKRISTSAKYSNVGHKG